MKIEINGLPEAIRTINDRIVRLKTELPPAYQEVVEKMVTRAASEAQRQLDRPNWLLSRAIGSKVKVYRDGRIVWGLSEALGVRHPAKNTPAFYAWYQEHGWHVDPNTVKRGRKRRYIKKKGLITAYRRQPGKHFFRKAFARYKQEFITAIDNLNRQIIEGRN